MKPAQVLNMLRQNLKKYREKGGNPEKFVWHPETARVVGLAHLNEFEGLPVIQDRLVPAEAVYILPVVEDTPAAREGEEG